MSRVSFSPDTQNANSGSPLKPRGGVSQYSNTAHNLQERRDAQRLNMPGKSFLVGDYDKFMDKFFGPKQDSTHSNSIPHLNPDVDCFNDVPSPPKEDKDMYKGIVEALNGSTLCPGFICIAHLDKSGNRENLVRSIDLGLYDRSDFPSGFPGSAVDWPYLDLPMECKPPKKSQDPMPSDPPGDEPRTDGQKQTYGQILTYAELIFRHQQRTFFFLVVIVADEARILRIDRSSIFFCERFHYKTENSKLSDFFARYGALTKEQRGWDVTAERVLPGTTLYDAMIEAGKKRDSEKFSSARDLFRESLDEKCAWWKLKVPVAPKTKKQDEGPQTQTRSDLDPNDSNDCNGLDNAPDAGLQYKTFLVAKPHFVASGVLGRGTRGYVAVPVEGEKVEDRFCYLKDAWRVGHPGIEQEGRILRELNEAKVPYVPTLHAHGDLPGEDQVTDWRDFVAELRPTMDKKDCRLKRHQHYRLVTKEVCKPLHQFGQFSRGLIMMIICCLCAHKKAYEMGIIHRDISVGNILIYQDPVTGQETAVLNDWELAKRFKFGVSSEKRQPDRTGTLEYMSVNALNNPDKEITVEDELESILHVIICIATRFVHSNLRAEHTGRFLHDYFDDFRENDGDLTCGAFKLSVIENGTITISSFNRSGPDAELRFLWPNGQKTSHPLNHIINELLSWFKALYAHQKLDVTSSSSLPEADSTEDFFTTSIYSSIAATLDDVFGSVESSDLKALPPTRSPADEALNKRLRENLATHDAFIKLLVIETKKTWPEKDRVDDKKPKAGYNKRRNHSQAGSTITGSMKRRREDDGEESTVSKRSRR